MQSTWIKTVFRWLPLLFIFAGIVFFIYFRGYNFLTLDNLNRAHVQLLLFTQQHYVLAVSIFMLIYIVVVALSMPSILILTLASGFLFGLIPGTIYVVISATIGATLLFLAVQTSIGYWLDQKAWFGINKLANRFKKNAFHYLLALRLLPLVPFHAVNIVPALFKVKARTFIITTFLGIIPSSFIYVLVGNNLRILFEIGVPPDLQVIFRPLLLVPLCSLALLVLLPVICRAIKGRYTRTSAKT